MEDREERKDTFEYKNKLSSFVKILCNVSKCPLWAKCKSRRKSECVFFNCLSNHLPSIEYTKINFPQIDVEKLIKWDKL